MSSIFGRLRQRSPDRFSLVGVLPINQRSSPTSVCIHYVDFRFDEWALAGITKRHIPTVGGPTDIARYIVMRQLPYIGTVSLHYVEIRVVAPLIGICVVFYPTSKVALLDVNRIAPPSGDQTGK